MSSLPDYINVEELQEIMRVYAHRLLLGYEDTHKEEFWVVAEKIAELYEYLLPFVSSQQAVSENTKFPQDYWMLCQKKEIYST
ncbi:MAG: hypothetical protein K2X39_08340 [Silvanigrellaceae bacterium]|nr:hypothetical protein [Silvanigrellaceae bacterium]